MLHLIRRRLFSDMNEETANSGRAKTLEENKEVALVGSGWELQANFQLCSELGTPGASVIYGPCQVEGGGKKREGGPALELRL